MGLLDGILGSSLDDPRTMATMQLAQGLLSSPKALQGLSGGLLAYGNTMQQAKQQQAAEEMRKMQLQHMALQYQQQKQAADQAEMDRTLTQKAMQPISGIEANRASGITGPRPEALNVVGQQPAFDPRQFVASGGSLQGAAGVAQLLAKERAKIKDYKEVRMPDGSVQIVGFDEYGKPVDTGRTPFKDGDVQDFGGAKYVRDPITNKLTLLGNKTATPDATLGASVTMRGQNMTDARARELNAITREGQQTQVVNDPIRGTMLVNKGTGLMRPAVGMDGQPVPSEEKVKAGKQSGQLFAAIGEAEKLMKQGPTASGVGSLIDKALNFAGTSTNSGDVAAQLDTLSGWLVANVPRMEGPQSNFDVANYQTMAGLVGDRTKPISTRMAALGTMKGLMQKYAAINGVQQAGLPTQQIPGLKFLGFEGQ